jgi:DNA polymerase III epsilon subunit
MRTRTQKTLSERRDLSPIVISIPAKSETEIKIDSHKRMVLGYRATSESMQIRNGKIEALKTSFLINTDDINITHPFPLTQLKNVATFRPVEQIVSYTRDYSPTEIATPKGSMLPRVSKLGALSIFSNAEHLTPILDSTLITELPKANKFKQTENYANVKSPEELLKFQSYDVTYTELEKNRIKDLKNNHRRSISQNKIMVNEGIPERKGSATQYVLASKLFSSSLKWEWLHLVANSIAGDKTQSANNLIAGTAYANTEMMFAEQCLSYLARIYKIGVHLDITARFIPETQIGTYLTYQIKTKHFNLNFDFNLQTINRPHIDYQNYFTYFVKSMVANTLSTNLPTDEGALKNPIFFSKKALLSVQLPIAKINNFVKKPFEYLEQSAVSNFVCLDTETTGLYADKGDRIVQIGCYRILNNKFKQSYEAIINPERSIPKILSQKGIHHITNAVVKGKPTFKQIESEFCKFIDGAILIGHNLPFDLTMLENELRLSDSKFSLVGMKAIDTLTLARTLTDQHELKPKSHKLGDLCDFFDINLDERSKGHDALIDAKLTIKLYEKLKNQFFKPQPSPISKKVPAARIKKKSACRF